MPRADRHQATIHHSLGRTARRRRRMVSTARRRAPTEGPTDTLQRPTATHVARHHRMAAEGATRRRARLTGTTGAALHLPIPTRGITASRQKLEARHRRIHIASRRPVVAAAVVTLLQAGAMGRRRMTATTRLHTVGAHLLAGRMTLTTPIAVARHRQVAAEGCHRRAAAGASSQMAPLAVDGEAAVEAAVEAVVEGGGAAGLTSRPAADMVADTAVITETEGGADPPMTAAMVAGAEDENGTGEVEAEGEAGTGGATGTGGRLGETEHLDCEGLTTVCRTEYTYSIPVEVKASVDQEPSGWH